MILKWGVQIVCVMTWEEAKMFCDQLNEAEKGRLEDESFRLFNIFNPPVINHFPELCGVCGWSPHYKNENKYVRCYFCN
ncbi:hypothetical protein [Cytobacillus sp. IB215316]|uniref:hypothetical protein n=1 Tax=Cytobacillus sp. IB215316 TaxID=3097354 RepID=UPI002A11E831|nr:hypothetical protein [Cytobacillus sp. IB215316]MDX8363467.1 hypothetical protein [Cytobacillus sp. IB215316]